MELKVPEVLHLSTSCMSSLYFSRSRLFLVQEAPTAYLNIEYSKLYPESKFSSSPWQLGT